MSEFTVGVVYTSREWRPAFQRYVRDHVGGVSLRLVRDSRMALEEHVDVLIVDDETSFLTPPFVASLRERGVKVVGLHDASDVEGHGRTLLERLGVDRALPATLVPEELLEQLRQLAPEVGLDARFDEVVAGVALENPSERSLVLAVGGPAGAGATEVTVALADVTSARRTVLVDVDEVAPGVARRLQLGLHPHLLTALDELRGAGLGSQGNEQGQPLQRALAQPAVLGGRRLGFDVIVGLANRGDWQLLRGDDVLGLIDELARSWECVVVNLGPHLEDLTRYVDRFGASRAVVGDADRIVGVCEASPRGVLRFLDWLVEVAELAPDQTVDVAVNRTPRSRFRPAELEEQLREHGGPRLASVTFLPEDRRVASATWDGVLVPRSRFRDGIEQLAAHVAGAPAPSRRRKVRR
ncbi:MAG: hypothetical protein M3396_04045 [Actinomycetota bacterium]|nr:hypothetical protein [Actinomycetota bacterium]